MAAGLAADLTAVLTADLTADLTESLAEAAASTLTTAGAAEPGVAIFSGAVSALIGWVAGIFNVFATGLLASAMKALTAGYTSSRQRLPLKMP